MSEEAFSETLSFTRCSSWNTKICPHLKDPHMQLSIINKPQFYLLNDQTVLKLNRMCVECKMFMKKLN